jgi:integrase/recombinase XerC
MAIRRDVQAPAARSVSAGAAHGPDRVAVVTETPDARVLPADLEAYLQHQAVQRRLAPRTLKLYRDALQDLARLAASWPVELRAVEPHHVRRWAALRRDEGLGPRSLALMLSAWRGLYRWLGREGWVRVNPVDGVRAPKAPRPLPKALAVDQAVALARHAEQSAQHTPEAALTVRDHVMVELLYGCGLRVAELVGMDLLPGSAARGWIDAADASACRGGGRRWGRCAPGWSSAPGWPRPTSRPCWSAGAARA